MSTDQPTESTRLHEEQILDRLSGARDRIKTELSKVIVGQSDAIDQLLISLLSGGHCLLTGAPGLAKTLLVRSLADLFELKFQRIQFTPDLMPADIIGTEILVDGGSGRSLEFAKGPVFANIVLADEINRTPPKTQAALLEAMQEKQVTAAGKTMQLDRPFFVLATQNPIEMEGTYPLPEAQLDRFMFNVVIDYLDEDDEVSVIQQTTSVAQEGINTLFSATDLLGFHELVRQVPVSEEVVRGAVKLVASTRPGRAHAPDFINDYVSWGAGLRAAQNLIIGGKTAALLGGKTHVSHSDIRELAHPVLRHRILPNYKAEAEGITVHDLVERLLEASR